MTLVPRPSTRTKISLFDSVCRLGTLQSPTDLAEHLCLRFELLLELLVLVPESMNFDPEILDELLLSFSVCLLPKRKNPQSVSNKYSFQRRVSYAARFCALLLRR